MYSNTYNENAKSKWESLLKGVMEWATPFENMKRNHDYLQNTKFY